MSDSAKVQLCIVWEDELRTAAKLLRAMEDAETDDDYQVAASHALRACCTALWGVADDHCLVMLGAASLHKWQKRATSTSNEVQP
jgi:hypothetical protein